MGNATATFPLSTPDYVINTQLRSRLGVNSTVFSVRTYLSDALTWNVELGGNTTVGGGGGGEVSRGVTLRASGGRAQAAACGNPECIWS